MQTKKVYKIKKKRFNLFSFGLFDILFLLILFFSIFLIFRLYFLQILNGEKYNELIMAQNNGYFISKVKSRGEIFFVNRDEKIPVATQGFGYTLAINPKTIIDSKKIFQILSKHITLDKKKYFKAVNKRDDPYEEILTKISEDDAKKILDEKIIGVILTKESWRMYPFNEVSSKIIGFLGYDGVGKYGLEKYYDDVLSRSDNVKTKKLFDLFFQNKSLNTLFSEKKISKEGNLVSSLDINVSKFVEKVLKKIDEKYKSKYSGVIVMKPSTGEIIAMSDSKEFDLNKDKKDFRNVFVEYRYEFGSIFKPFVAAIGLETRSINTNFSYNDTGCVKILKYTICNFDRKARGKNTGLQEIISKSLNLGTIAIEKKIGHDTFFNFIAQSGIESETGIDLPGEISSDLSSLNYKNDVNYATASFGQGISFTPIGMSRVFAILGNGGFLVRPHLIKRIEYGSLIPDEEIKIEKKRIFSVDTINKITDILIKRTDFNDKQSYINKSYSVAAKSGTAQISNSQGGYLDDKYIHTIAGFFPALAKIDDRYLIFLWTVEPQGVKYSSGSLRDSFYEIVNFLISYYNIQPDRSI